MLNIVLVEPEIPGNTGNIGRTCVAIGLRLHLIRPLGFDPGIKAAMHAGLDYWPRVDLHIYDDLPQFFESNPAARNQLWLATTKAPQSYDGVRYGADDYLFFGKESAGLPEDFRMKYYDRCVRLPMRPEERSLNLSNSVAILAYEALRQNGFPGLSGCGEMKEIAVEDGGQI